MQYLKIFLLSILFIGLKNTASAQDEQLARQYLENGEYEKATVLYEQLYKKFPFQDYYFRQYITGLIETKNYQVAENELKKQLKLRPENLQLYIAFSDLLVKQDKNDEAQKMYKKAIEKISASDPNQALLLKDAFMQRFLPKWALLALERGNEAAKEKNYFAFYEAEVLRALNDRPKMIGRYLDALDRSESIEQSLEATFQRYFSEEDYTELVTQLYARIQTNTESIAPIELLIWVLGQRKDFRAALRQVKALDRRMGENGTRVMNFARTTEAENDFDTAIDAYRYLNEKGETTPYFVEGQKGVLRCLRDKLTKGLSYTKDDIASLDTDYAAFMNRYGWTVQNAEIVRDWAKLDVFYKNDLAKGVLLLDSLLKLPRLNPKTAGEAKLELGDYYLMQGEPWEATLLYSQVDKSFKEDDLGEMGRYKNAKLAYYNGDFEWAQTQLKVLKASTSELISNDAIDLSVFIMDNLNLDTSAVAMKLYSTAELLTFQNRFDEAFEKLDSLQAQFPKHSLDDDILYAKAQVFKRQHNYTEAAKYLQRIITNYPEEIRGDNATFELAELSEMHLNDKAAAQKLYEKIIVDYSSSTFVIEARKRFRALRGDKVN
ncbi:MAG: hypothetical protein RI894_372 [Bacteroidota bacterium]